MGHAMFRREGGRLVPTETAQMAEADIRAIFEALSRIEQKSAPAASLTRPLRVAAASTLAHTLLPGVIAAYSRLSPDHRIVLEIYSSDAQVIAVAEERIDLALIDVVPSHSGVRVTPFRETDIVALMRRDDPLSALSVITPHDIAARSLIAQTRRHSVRAAIEEVMAQAGVSAEIRVEVATVIMASRLVAEGLGIALINPFPAALEFDDSLCLRPFSPRITMKTSFLTPIGAPLSHETMTFMSLVRSAAGTELREDQTL